MSSEVYYIILKLPLRKTIGLANNILTQFRLSVVIGDGEYQNEVFQRAM